jgi:hypothetical protein
MDNSVNIGLIYEDESMLMNNVRMLVRKIHTFSQFHFPVPDGTMAELEFKICPNPSTLNDCTVPEDKIVAALPFDNFEMVLYYFSICMINLWI